MVRALGLISGGLDSTLAAMTLMRQGIDVTGICYVTPFFGAAKARRAAEAVGFPLIVLDIGEMHLEMVKAPRYGYGKNMNPCIDCHAMMFRLAGERMAQGGFDFLFSGEVLGQRPMSQNMTALQAVAKHSGYPDRILRPLCARLLPPTPMEEAGLVDREQLLDIQGRSRKRQEELAPAWGWHDWPPSGGGCLLTEAGFSRRLRDLVDHQPDCTLVDVELLKHGRQFRLSPQAKLVLGRDQESNERLETLAEDRLQLRCRDVNGPLGVFCGQPADADLACAAGIVAAYGQARDQARVAVSVLRAGAEVSVLRVSPLDRAQAQQLQLT